MARTLTLQSATTDPFDTGWIGKVGTVWTGVTLRLNVTGKGRREIQLTRQIPGTTLQLFSKDVSWEADDDPIDVVLGDFAGQIRLTCGLAAESVGSTLAASIVASGDIVPWDDSVGVGSPSSPYPTSTTPAELVTLAATGPEEIWVVNPCVPRGKSRLVVNAGRTKYVPPPRELLFRLRTGDTPISLTPGVAAIVPVFESTEIIPAYMFSDIFWLSANMYIKNAAGAAGCMLMVAVSGIDPTSVEASEYPLFTRNFTPTASGTGIRPEQVGYGEISGADILKGAWGIGDPNTGATVNSRGRMVPFGNNAGRFDAASMKVYAKAVTKHANDNIVLHWIDVWSD
jgi:hypothetical protein